MKYFSILFFFIPLLGCSGGGLSTPTSDSFNFAEAEVTNQFSSLRELEFGEKEGYQFSEITDSFSFQEIEAFILLNGERRIFENIQVFRIGDSFSDEEAYSIVVIAHNSSSVTLGVAATFPSEFFYIFFSGSQLSTLGGFLGVHYEINDLIYTGPSNREDLVFSPTRISHSFLNLPVDVLRIGSEGFEFVSSTRMSGIISATNYELEEVRF